MSLVASADQMYYLQIAVVVLVAVIILWGYAEYQKHGKSASSFKVHRSKSKKGKKK